MNVTFGLPTEALEKRFAVEAEELGMGGLKDTAVLADCGPRFTMRCRWQAARSWLNLWKLL